MNDYDKQELVNDVIFITLCTSVIAAAFATVVMVTAGTDGFREMVGSIFGVCR